MFEYAELQCVPSSYPNQISVRDVTVVVVGKQRIVKYSIQRVVVSSLNIPQYNSMTLSPTS